VRGLDPVMFGVHSVISCRPKFTSLGAHTAAVVHCGPNLERTIATLKPKVVVAMGEAALQKVAGVSNILRYRGRVIEKGSYLVVPTLHPRDLLAKKADDDDEGALRHPPRFTGVCIWDLKKAVALTTTAFSRTPTRYLCDPSVEEFTSFAQEYERALAQNAETRLSWDIETPYKLKKSDEDDYDEGERDNQIVRISFAFQEGYAASVPWSGPYLPVIRRLLRSRGAHVVWNGDTFDVPLVRQNDLEVLGRVEDYMWGFHLWQSDLPKGLEWVTSFFSDLLPWKHLNNENPALYSCIDADAALRNANGLRKALEASGQWELFQRHVVDLDPLLYEAGERGNLIDLDKHEELKAKFAKEKHQLIEEVQGMVPEELHPRKRYKKQPKVDPTRRTRKFEAVVVEGKVKRCTHCGAEGVKKGTHFKGGKKNPCKAAGATIEVVKGNVIELDEILPFNPNSTDQIKNYIKHYDHPLGTNRFTKNESADSKHLAKLAKRYGDKHPLYTQTIKIHKVSKGLSTYVLGFAPDDNGLIHTTYDHTPSTWRLASKNVNLQNVGKREGNLYAKEARDQIIARPGYLFVAADSSAIEAVFVGHFMGDSSYIELARKGVHDFLTCYELGIKFTKESIEHYKASNPDHYKNTRDKCKIVVHGTNYGMTPKLMIELFPEIFPTMAEAKRMQDRLFEALPGLSAWQYEVRVRGHKETYLQSPWGYRHWFYDVFKKDQRTGAIVSGKDANKAVAFLPQNSAAAFMKDNLLILGKTWLRNYSPANLSVHDGYTYEVPEDRAGEAEELLVETLTRPIPQMGGLRVGCETEAGHDWGKGMEKIRKVEV
jgi:DNA polymerase I-like protein with 3'-5' exonuclease and polymerase domains